MSIADPEKWPPDSVPEVIEDTGRAVWGVEEGMGAEETCRSVLLKLPGSERLSFLRAPR